MATDPLPSTIDLSGFSQAELLSLSRCSRSVQDKRDVLVPEIAFSIFNQSVATRQQTYAKFRLHANRRKNRSETDPVREDGLEKGDGDDLDENRLIVGLLKDLLKTSKLHDPAEEERIRWTDEAMVDCEGGVRMRRKRAGKAGEMGAGQEIVNKNGVVVDLVALENEIDPYGEELKRRTTGLVSEDDLLGFLRGLDGEWGSTRKKRRKVDASEFGDYLPVKWKLLLSLGRRESRIWLYCRRYISPGGQEFISCKDAALYLQSLFGNSNDLVDVKMDNIEHSAGTLFMEDSLGNSNFPVSALHKSSVAEKGREMVLERTEKLVDVQVFSLFECQQCKLVFHEKKLYLRHVLSWHEKTTKRYRIGSRERNGVILDNGQYECQFCYEIILEKESYDSHVGDHVRDSYNETLGRTRVGIGAELVTLSSGSIKPFSKAVEGSVIKVMNYCHGDSTTANYNDCSDVLTLIKAYVPASRDDILNLVRKDQLMGTNSLVPGIYSANSGIACPTDSTIFSDEQHIKVLECQREVPGDKHEIKACENTRPAGVVDFEHSISVGKRVNYKGKIDELGKKTISARDSGESELMMQPWGHLNDLKSTPCKGEELSCFCEKLETVVELEYNLKTIHDFRTNTDTHMKLNLERSAMTSGELNVSENTIKSALLVEPSFHTTEFSSTPCEEADLPTFRQMPENPAETEELKLDAIQSPKIRIPTREESVPLSVDIEKDAVVNEFEANRVEGEGTLCRMECRPQVTAVCVWCNLEFIYEVVNIELLADSVGYMCTTCKEKISAQFSASTMVRPST